MKEGFSDYKKIRKRWFFKESLTEWFYVEPKKFSSMASLEEPYEAPLFLRVYYYYNNNTCNNPNPNPNRNPNSKYKGYMYFINITQYFNV